LAGKNSNPPEKNIINPKRISRERSCPLKTVEPSEKHPRNPLKTTLR